MITPEQAELFEAAIDSALLDVHVSTPGVVQSYDRNAQSADIEVQVRRALDDENDEIVYEDLGVLKDVPVWQPGGSSSFLHLDLVPGDTGIILFASYGIGQWRTVPGLAYPDTASRHGLDGAIFLPGLRKDSGLIAVPPAGGAILKTLSGGEIEISATGQVSINGNLTVLP